MYTQLHWKRLGPRSHNGRQGRFFEKVKRRHGFHFLAAVVETLRRGSPAKRREAGQRGSESRPLPGFSQQTLAELGRVDKIDPALLLRQTGGVTWRNSCARRKHHDYTPPSPPISTEDMLWRDGGHLPAHLPGVTGMGRASSTEPRAALPFTEFGELRALWDGREEFRSPGVPRMRRHPAPCEHRENSLKTRPFDTASSSGRTWARGVTDVRRDPGRWSGTALRTRPLWRVSPRQPLNDIPKRHICGNKPNFCRIT
ncbi:hypothetical protein GN956_G13357 [Arapaima gigas]